MTTAEHCVTPDEELVAYADSEMERAAAEQMRWHLEVCSECRLRVQGLRRSLALAHETWSAHEWDLNERPSIGLSNWHRRYVCAAGAAAAIVLAFLLYREDSRHSGQLVSNLMAETASAQRPVEQEIWEAMTSHQMLEVAELLAQQPGGQPYAVSRLTYVIRHFPATDASAQARDRLTGLSRMVQ